MFSLSVERRRVWPEEFIRGANQEIAINILDVD